MQKILYLPHSYSGRGHFLPSGHFYNHQGVIDRDRIIQSRLSDLGELIMCPEEKLPDSVKGSDIEVVVFNLSVEDHDVPEPGWRESEPYLKRLYGRTISLMDQAYHNSNGSQPHARIIAYTIALPMDYPREPFSKALERVFRPGHIYAYVPKTVDPEQDAKTIIDSITKMRHSSPSLL